MADESDSLLTMIVKDTDGVQTIITNDRVIRITESRQGASVMIRPVESYQAGKQFALPPMPDKDGYSAQINVYKTVR